MARGLQFADDEKRNERIIAYLLCLRYKSRFQDKRSMVKNLIIDAFDQFAVIKILPKFT